VKTHVRFTSAFWEKKPFCLLDRVIVVEKIDKAYQIVNEDQECEIKCIKKEIKQCLDRVIKKLMSKKK